MREQRVKANTLCLTELVANPGPWKSISLKNCGDPLRGLAELTTELSH